MIDLWFVLPAVALLVGACALVPLGQQVLQRGVVFMDLAVAQAAAAGSLWALVALHQHADGADVALDLAGLAGSLLCALAVAGLSRLWPQRREALIGLLYVLCACLALLGARMDPHGRDRMLELLAADVLWVQPAQAMTLALAAALLWGALLYWPRLLERDMPFYTGFALVISVAVPVLGLFLVFALLIGPALWLGRLSASGDHAQERPRANAPAQGVEVTQGGARLGLSRIRPLFVPLLLAWAACLLGLASSWWWDAPSGACVALACALLGLAAVWRRPKAR